MNSSQSLPAKPETGTVRPATPADNGYGRARLRLGVIGVGMWVVISSGVLSLNAIDSARELLPSGISGDVILMGLLILAYVLIQLPLDWLGGHQFPKQFGRRVSKPAGYAWTLVRGITCHSLLLLTSAVLLYCGGKLFGLPGAYAAGLVWIAALAAGRGWVARVIARLPRAALIQNPNLPDATPTELTHSTDEGFTGGITGFLSPNKNILPVAWKDRLDPKQFDLSEARRQKVVQTGAWRAGRLAAFIFTATGLLFALLMAGPASAGTAIGVIETSLWFTLWSFAGLLILPSLSRAAVYRVDQQLIVEGLDPQEFERLSAVLDGFQDAEPDRSRWIERIFHPIPSVSNRSSSEPKAGAGFWDIARTSVYLGIGCLSLLTRSVHCNVGRPALWVWLPTD